MSSDPTLFALAPPAIRFRSPQHRNVLYFDEAAGHGDGGGGGGGGGDGPPRGRVWRLADLDAAARTGEEITELMGYVIRSGS